MIRDTDHELGRVTELYAYKAGWIYQVEYNDGTVEFHVQVNGAQLILTSLREAQHWLDQHIEKIVSNWIAETEEILENRSETDSRLW